MNCKKCRTELIGFLRGVLPEDQESAMRHHLDECPECRSFAGYVSAVLGRISGERSIAPDPFLSTRIEGLLQGKVASGSVPVAVPRFIPAVVFSLFIIAGIFGGFGIGRLISGQPEDVFHDQEEISLMMDDFGYEPIESFLLDPFLEVTGEGDR